MMASRISRRFTATFLVARKEGSDADRSFRFPGHDDSPISDEELPELFVIFGLDKAEDFSLVDEPVL